MVTLYTLPGTPPKALADLIVSKVNSFNCVTDPAIEGKLVVAKTGPTLFSPTHEKLRTLMEGLVDGFIAAEVKPKPYSLNYTTWSITKEIKKYHVSVEAMLTKYQISHVKDLQPYLWILRKHTEYFEDANDLMAREAELRELHHTAQYETHISTFKELMKYTEYHDITIVVDKTKQYWANINW